MRIETTDVASSGFGTPWSHTRTYSNQQKVDFDRGNGWNWNPVNWPYLAQSSLEGSSLTLYGNLYNLRYFDYDAYSDSYTSRFGDLSRLEHDSGSHELRLIEPDGTVVIFHDINHVFRPGGFVSSTSPGGTTLAVTEEVNDRIVEMQRSVTVDDYVTTESFLYEYFDSGDLSGHIYTCTVRKRLDSEDPWENVSQVEYSYYGSGSTSSSSSLSSSSDNEPFGSLADLRTATRRLWENAAWVDTGTDYYRYYKAGSTKGGAHDLKYVCGPEAFARLAANVSDPFTASDEQVSLYADYYYEYDGSDRVTLERVFAGSMTVQYAFERNPRYPIGSSSSSSSAPGPPNYNTWIYKTTETKPDDSQRITFANFAGQTMLSVLKASAASSDQWCKYYRYDDQGRSFWAGQPSAVLGYDEAYDDLLHYQPESGKYQYLRDHDGLIEVTEYYTSSGSSSSSEPTPFPEGYLKSTQIMKGQLATPVLLRSWEYTDHTAGGLTVYPVAKEIQYPDELDPDQKITTQYGYTFHSDTTQIAVRTTTLPEIPTEQNGSGVANSRKEYFDILGYRTWSMDERGFITRYVYNTENGALIQRIDDVDTSTVSGAPSGWTTPSGGGLNLTTDFESDRQGRITQELGPEHVVDIAGVATTIRRASWTVYDDANQTVRRGRGYASGSGPDYTYTLINPVQIRQSDQSGKPLAEIAATRASTAGKLLPTDSFSQSSYVRWKNYQYTDCCLLASQRVYRLIPSSGTGVSGTNYDETVFGYDVNKRRNRVVTPGGTITFSVLDVRSLVQAVYVGTDDSGATESDPTGGGAPGNNMVLVSSNQYDDGESGGNGNLTRVTQQVDAETARETESSYDWRNRLLNVDGEMNAYAEGFYDNLDRLIRVDRRDTSAEGNLIARQDTHYDDLGRVYQTIRYGVDPETGTVGNALTDNVWFDPTGNIAKTASAGSDLWTKTTFDSLSRPTVSFKGLGTDADYDEIFSVSEDVILEQSETAYDDAGNPIQQTQRLRYHDAPDTQTGALESPSTTPKARVAYSASYPDPLGRLQANADYGTNGGDPFTRSTTIPTRASTVLVGSQSYDDSGNLLEAADTGGMVTRFSYDAAGRRLQVIENYVASPPASSSSSGTGCSSSADVNRTTNFSYSPDGLIGTLEAVNASTGNQVTTYSYGTTLSDSDVAASVLLRSVAYPDSAGSNDQVWLAYNRQSQRISFSDQNGTVHQYDYDLLGRLTQDRVTTLASQVDAAIQRVESAYEVRGMLDRLTTFDNPTVGTGNIVNEVRHTYNDFGQPVRAYQSHAGAVNLLTTPSVQTIFADGSTNTIRPTALIYPDGRELSYDYGMSTSIDDLCSRIASLIDSDVSSTHLTDYSYLGLGTVVQQASPQPNLRYTLISLTGSDDPDAGDIYSGLDRFGRIVDLRWRNTSNNSDLSRVQYGYDPSRNRTWRENPTATANSAEYDWKYSYDGLRRLKAGQRGTLNGSHTGLTSQVFSQCWSLDETGNWSGFKQSDDGTSWSLEQTRSANPVNELTAIDATVGEQWANPQYDPNGNMTRIPRPGLNRPSWANLTMAQWAALTVGDWARMEVAPNYRATFDAWNRLVSLADGGDSSLIQQNQYDGRGFRVVTKSYAEGTLFETRHAYFTDQWQIVEERLGTSPDSADPNRQFVWGVRYIDDLILRDHDTGGGTLSERLYALQDANWNVTAVANTSGSVTERYEYDPYGNTAILSNAFVPRATSTYGWETTYCGYRRDQNTGLFAIRNRFYHPRLGTWVTRDPIGYHDGPSLYFIYATINSTDPLGLTIEICFRQFTGTPGSKTFVKDTDAWQKRFRNRTPVLFGLIGSTPELAHAYLKITDNGTTSTYSYHPYPFPEGAPNFSDSNVSRPGRVWKNHPADLTCNVDKKGLDSECFEIDAEGKEEELIKYIDDWWKTNQAGYDEGSPIADPLIKGNTIGETKHDSPGDKCSADYWVTGQNCAWFATRMMAGVGITGDQMGIHRYNLKWNDGRGITSWDSPEGTPGINNVPGSRPLLQGGRPGTFGQDKLP